MTAEFLPADPVRRARCETHPTAQRAEGSAGPNALNDAETFGGQSIQAAPVRTPCIEPCPQSDSAVRPKQKGDSICPHRMGRWCRPIPRGLRVKKASQTGSSAARDPCTQQSFWIDYDSFRRYLRPLIDFPLLLHGRRGRRLGRWRWWRRSRWLYCSFG